MGLLSQITAGADAKVCPALPEPVYDTVPIAGNVQFKELALYISAPCMAIAVLISIAQIFMHATHLSNRHEQVRIIRIISIIPFFAVVGFIDIVVGRGSIYLNPWLDAYESIPLASFLLLLGAYISPDAEDRLAHLEGIKSSKMDRAKNGAIVFTRTWIAVFQYPVIAFLVAIITDITQATNILCPNSNGVHFAHLWLTIIRLISVTVAVLAILRFTSLLRRELQQHSIVKKLFGFKGIVFVFTVQTTVFTFLGGEITSTDKLSYNDITNSVPSLMLCVEMILFAIFFFYAYPWAPYIIRKDAPASVDHEAYSPVSAQYQGGFLGLKGILLALDPTEILLGIVTAVKLAISGGRPSKTSVDYNQATQTTPAMQDQYPMKPQEQTSNGIAPQTYPQAYNSTASQEYNAAAPQGYDPRAPQAQNTTVP